MGPQVATTEERKWVGRNLANSTVKIDDEEYVVAELSEECKALITQLNIIEAKLSETKNMQAVLTRAKNSYVQGLKEEIIRTKAGL